MRGPPLVPLVMVEGKRHIIVCNGIFLGAGAVGRFKPVLVQAAVSNAIDWVA